MKKSPFTAAKLLRHQKEHGFNSHTLALSTDLLTRYRQEYAVKRALYDALFNTLNESVAQITVQTVTSQVQLMVPHELLEAAIQPLLDSLERQLGSQEKWILEQAAHVEAGRNECGLDASEQQWAVATFLAQPIGLPQPAPMGKAA